MTQNGNPKCRRSADSTVSLAMISAAAAVALLVSCFFLDPAAAPVFPKCLFHALTGLYCPGCGTLRAMHLILHGHLTESIQMNPLPALSLPIGAMLFVRRNNITVALWVIFIALIFYGVLRNLET